MDAMSMLILMALLLIKHYVADFPLQRPFMYLNKGTYGAWGGVAHALAHAVGTFAAVCWLVPPLEAYALGLADGMIHYHVDWLKVFVTRSQGWSEYVGPVSGPSSTLPQKAPWRNAKSLGPHLAIYSNAYFQALGLDQLAHVLTYVLIAAMVARYAA